MATLPTQTRQTALSANQSRTGSLMGVQILGTGSYTPPRVVTNADLAALGYDEQWIVQRTGIRERRYVDEGVHTSDLAVEAAKQCIERSGVDPQAIDLVLVTTSTPDMPMPATASMVQDRLGLSALAFDLQAACAGFMFALLTGMQYVATGCSRLALVIAADTYSRIINPEDKQTYPLFGDGAGAVLLAPGTQQQGLVSYAVGSDGSGAGLVYRGMGGSRLPFGESSEHDPQRFLIMDGKPIFKWAIRVLEDTTRLVLDTANLSLADIDLAILHQANLRIINAAVGNLGLAPQKVYNNIDRYGNTSAATVPLALDEAYRDGRIGAGDLLLLSGFGGGLLWGTALLRW